MKNSYPGINSKAVVLLIMLLGCIYIAVQFTPVRAATSENVLLYQTPDPQTGEDTLIDVIEDYLLSSIFSLIFGALGTTLLFYLTKHPTKSEDIRKRIKQEMILSARKDLNLHPDATPPLLTFSEIMTRSEMMMDLATEASIIATLSIETYTPEYHHYQVIAIFEPADQNLFDKLVDRPGLHQIKFIMYIDFSGISELQWTVDDFTRNGIKDLIIRTIFRGADSQHEGFLMVAKNSQGKWTAHTIPSITEIYQGIVHKEPAVWNPEKSVAQNLVLFQTPGATQSTFPPQAYFQQSKVSETKFDLLHDGTIYPYYSYSTGTVLRGEHSVLKYPVLLVITQVYYINGNDSEGWISPHRLLFTMFRVTPGGFILDSNWNHGAPILTAEPRNISDVDINSIVAQGYDRHMVGRMYFYN